MNRPDDHPHPERDRSRERSVQLLFVTAILASSFLIFLVQPMVGKRILPWFGGTPSVWTLCLAFYQTTLFLGYAYAHLLIRFASSPAQVSIHALLVGAAFFALPVLPSDAWQNVDVLNPSSEILQMLGSNVALPFIVLASTGPLVQAWFARVYPESSPYPLYAVSNIGSFAALLAYPFLLEPRLSLSMTGMLWSYAFATTGITVVVCAFVARGGIQSSRGPSASSQTNPTGRTDGDSVRVSEARDENVEQPTAFRVGLWILLSASAVILLMGVTNSVCLDVASVPFLWILPLATYLLTFILCFASERNYRPIPLIVLTLVTSFLTVGFHFTNDMIAVVASEELAESIFRSLRSLAVQIPAYCGLLFGGCMIMHGELYRLRPPATSLTAFYLCVSAGGALGGLFVGLLAPILFDGYYEIRVGLGLTGLLIFAASALHTTKTNPRLDGWRWRIAAPLLMILGLYSVIPPGVNHEIVIHNERSFFGVLQVIEKRHDNVLEHHLMSGTTLHGVEFIGDRTQPLPTTYFGRATGIAATFAQLSASKNSKIGIIGLGVGTLSAYGRPGDYFRYYEIDPLVVEIAGASDYFSFLERSMANVDVVIGDARLEIEREQRVEGSQEFDLLILDAFNSDAIPVHLLTLEAFRLYVESLASDGLLAVHISNRHFDLLPLVARAGYEVGLTAVDFRTGPAPGFQSLNAQWIILSSNPQRVQDLASLLTERIRLMNLSPTHAQITFPQAGDLEQVSFWTDDYSDLLSALKP